MKVHPESLTPLERYDYCSEEIVFKFSTILFPPKDLTTMPSFIA
jgi:hypothetical protein